MSQARQLRSTAQTHRQNSMDIFSQSSTDTLGSQPSGSQPNGSQPGAGQFMGDSTKDMDYRFEVHSKVPPAPSNANLPVKLPNPVVASVKITKNPTGGAISSSNVLLPSNGKTKPVKGKKSEKNQLPPVAEHPVEKMDEGDKAAKKKKKDTKKEVNISILITECVDTLGKI